MESLRDEAYEGEPGEGQARAVIELNRQLRRAQDAIRRRTAGVTAEVVLRSGFDKEGEGEWQQLLCFGAVDGQWCLYLKSGYLARPQHMRHTDLFTSNLETRCLAAKKVPVLVQALEAVEIHAQESVSAVARALSRYVDWIRLDA